jgi:uncharacterized protein (TIGR02246 family)
MMISFNRVSGIVALFLIIASSVVLRSGSLAIVKAADSTPPSVSGTAAQSSHDADEKAFRATADEFVKAFNAGDAKTIGAQWSTDAAYIDESGQVFHGRDAIQKEYAQLFKEHPGATVALFIDSFRFFGPDAAVERGIAKVKLAGEKTSSAARYNVVHARRDGKWIMVAGHDIPYVSDLDDDHLKDLEWLIGQWKPEDANAGPAMKFEWMGGRNFIKNTYTTSQNGQTTLSGGQIIGWNPKLAKIVSWRFDPAGGFGNDVWTKDGNKWTTNATATLHEGSDATAVNTITKTDGDHFTWQSTDQTLDGVHLPDAAPVKMVRVQGQN